VDPVEGGQDLEQVGCRSTGRPPEDGNDPAHEP
jgi:hypothetical protein